MSTRQRELTRAQRRLLEATRNQGWMTVAEAHHGGFFRPADSLAALVRKGYLTERERVSPTGVIRFSIYHPTED